MTLQLKEKFRLIDGPIAHDVYFAGEGPAVVLMHELPGMTPGCLRAAERIIAFGFKVYLPLFFGEVNQNSTLKGLAATTFCVRHEFNLFTTGGRSPIAGWLRELCRRADAECGGRGVGLIGMCLTGSVVLSVMLEPVVRVPVMCEPVVPFLDREDLGVPEEDIAQAKIRAADAPILAFRFETDWLCPTQRFEALRSTFVTNVRTVEIPTGPHQPFNIPDNAHSVLTGDYPGQDNPAHPVSQAFEEILERFRAALV